MDAVGLVIKDGDYKRICKERALKKSKKNERQTDVRVAVE